MALGLSPIDGYAQSDTDETATSPQYYGFLQAGGPAQCSWYISQAVTTSSVMAFRYIAGSGLTSYQTSWTNRASLSYDYYSNVFQNT